MLIHVLKIELLPTPAVDDAATSQRRLRVPALAASFGVLTGMVLLNAAFPLLLRLLFRGIQAVPRDSVRFTRESSHFSISLIGVQPRV